MQVTSYIGDIKVSNSGGFGKAGGQGKYDSFLYVPM